MFTSPYVFRIYVILLINSFDIIVLFDNLYELKWINGYAFYATSSAVSYSKLIFPRLLARWFMISVSRHQFIPNRPDEKRIYKANYTLFDMRKSRNLNCWHQSRCWQWVYHLHVASHETFNMICFISANSVEKIRTMNLSFCGTPFVY